MKEKCIDELTKSVEEMMVDLFEINPNSPAYSEQRLRDFADKLVERGWRKNE